SGFRFQIVSSQPAQLAASCISSDESPLLLVSVPLLFPNPFVCPVFSLSQIEFLMVLLLLVLFPTSPPMLLMTPNLEETLPMAYELERTGETPSMYPTSPPM